MSKVTAMIFVTPINPIVFMNVKLFFCVVMFFLWLILLKRQGFEIGHSKVDLTRKMVPITRRASSCLALALSILLSSLAHLSSSLSYRYFFFSGSHPNSIFNERKQKIKNELPRVFQYHKIIGLPSNLRNIFSLKEQFLVWTFLK